MEEGYALKFRRFLDFLFSLDGREYLFACALLRGLTYDEMSDELHCSKSTLSKLKRNLLPKWQGYVEDLKSGQEEPSQYPEEEDQPQEAA